MSNSKRIAAIDWMRGFVMVLMTIDHAAMAYNANHFSKDSALTYEPGMLVSTAEFYTRWITHLCAPVFVFLAGAALAISIERKVAKGISSSVINSNILKRGAFIAILDPTVISIFSGKLTFQVLYAIGVAIMCMAFLRLLSTKLLLPLAVGWIAFGELLTVQFWPPQDGSATLICSALLFSRYSNASVSIVYPLIPWLAMMILGWVFGRYLLDYREGKTSLGPVALLYSAAAVALLGFIAIRYFNGYGNMELLREGNSLMNWLFVSKYPPSASFACLELGLMCFILGTMIWLERIIGVRPNGFLLVLGQTSMFFYLVHRLAFEGSATYLGLADVGTIETTYIVSFVALLILYPMCWWYRGFKQRHPGWLLTKYI